MNNSQQSSVSFHGAQFKFGNQPIDLVEDKAGGYLLDPGLAEDGVGLDVDALNGVDEEEGAVGEAGGGGDLAAEVHVAGGVDEVDGVVEEAEGDGGALHGYGAALLLVKEVHEAEAAGELRVEDAAAGGGDQVVG